MVSKLVYSAYKNPKSNELILVVINPTDQPIDLHLNINQRNKVFKPKNHWLAYQTNASNRLYKTVLPKGNVVKVDQKSVTTYFMKP